MKVLITGAGVIGTHVAKRLLERGDEIVLLDLNPQVAYVRQVAGDVQLVQSDLCDHISISRILQQYKIEAVVHSAGRMGHSFALNSLESYQSNVIGTSTLADVCRHTTVQRVLYCSSLAVYGELENGPVKEERQPQPQSVYGVSKYANELLLRSVSDQGRSFELVTLRLAGVYGFGMFAGGAWMGKQLTQLIALTLSDPATNKWGALGINEYLYVKDVAVAVEKGIHSEGLHGEVFNIGTGRQHEPEEVRSACLKALGLKVLDKTYQEIPGLLDCTKAHQQLGFLPAFSLEKGVTDLVDQIRGVLERR